MREYEVNTTYEPFSREPEYIEGNRAFVQQLPLRTAKRILDLACGTGVISDLIFEVQPSITVFGLDISRESLMLGLSDFRDRGLSFQDGFVLTGDLNGGQPKLTLIEGTADCLPFKDSWADIVFMGHSIHMLPDFDLLLDEIKRVLAPGGIFAFNSSFYAGSQAEGTDHFYQLWWKKALTYILDKDAELKRQGFPGIRRQRGTYPKGRPWLSREDWKGLLQNHGFEIMTLNERTVMMTKSALENIGSYSGFASAALSGYPVKLASEAVVYAVEPALKASGLDRVPRLWLEIAVRKK
jgi:ubiquinone/menaquinone biosynthesis C-methylase UbiE